MNSLNFFSQQKEEPETKSEPRDKEPVPTLSSGRETDKVYWPCAPDGYIPNSVVRKRVKPRRVPARFIPQMRRAEPKKKQVTEEEEEVDESKSKIKGNLKGGLCFTFERRA